MQLFYVQVEYEFKTVIVAKFSVKCKVKTVKLKGTALWDRIERVPSNWRASNFGTDKNCEIISHMWSLVSVTSVAQYPLSRNLEKSKA